MRLFDERRRAILMSNNFRGYARTVSGNPVTLADCMNDYPVSVSVSGNTVQDGTPTPEAPIEMHSCGDRTANLFDAGDTWYTFKDNNGWFEVSKDNTNGTASAYTTPFVHDSDLIEPSTQYTLVVEVAEISNCTIQVSNPYTGDGHSQQFTNGTISIKTAGTFIYTLTSCDDLSACDMILRNQVITPSGSNGKAKFRISVLPYDETITADNFVYEPFGYKVPVNINGSQSFNIYTKEPINGNTDVADVIKLDVDSKTCTDMRNYGVATPTTTDISSMQNWDSIPKLNRGTNIITAETEVEPSAIEVNYYADKTGA